jgi:signal transduction histidine kinase
MIALQNNELYEKAEKDATRFSLLYRTGKEMSNISDETQLDHAYDAILNFAEEHSKSLVIIRVLEEDTQELVVKRISRGHEHIVLPRISLDGYAPGVALREKRTICINDTHHAPPDLRLSLPENSPVRSTVMTPIQLNHRSYGILILANETVGFFRDADIPFFEGLAQQLASTIHRIETMQERKEFEKRAFAAEVMSTIGQSAYELTHRLGNGLGLVESYVDTIQAELRAMHVNNAMVSKKLDNIVQSVRTVLTLSNNLRSGVANLKYPDEVKEPFVSVLPLSLFKELQKQLFLPASITLTVQHDSDIAPVRVIRSLVLDILHNLVNNAVDAMPNGGHITLRARNDGRLVILEVADNGPGIPEPLKPRIFDLFFSSKGSSGFGLWSARRNALRNHGVLDVKSEPGRGTIFTLQLPRGECEDENRGDASL